MAQRDGAQQDCAPIGCVVPDVLLVEADERVAVVHGAALLETVAGGDVVVVFNREAVCVVVVLRPVDLDDDFRAVREPDNDVVRVELVRLERAAPVVPHLGNELCANERCAKLVGEKVFDLHLGLLLAAGAALAVGDVVGGRLERVKRAVGVRVRADPDELLVAAPRGRDCFVAVLAVGLGVPFGQRHRVARDAAVEAVRAVGVAAEHIASDAAIPAAVAVHEAEKALLDRVAARLAAELELGVAAGGDHPRLEIVLVAPLIDERGQVLGMLRLDVGRVGETRRVAMRALFALAPHFALTEPAALFRVRDVVQRFQERVFALRAPEPEILTGTL